MELKITCEGSDVIDYKTIKVLQDSLKTRQLDDIENMIKYIIQDGFSFPMFVYKHKENNYAIDGHGRILALSMMESVGYRIDETGNLKRDGEPWTIPSVPCVYILAKDLHEAKVKLLKLNSEYGKITQIGFQEFVKDLDFKEYSGIPLRITEVDVMGDIEPNENFGDIIIDAVLEEPSDSSGPVFEPILDPKIDTSIVTEEAIDKALEKEKNRRESDVPTIRLVCKHCGETFIVKKTDALFLINQKIKDLKDARN
jgi:hypothetical protein